MKILRVISSMNPTQGGPAQGIRNSIPEMHRLGHVNEVVCFDTGSEDYCGTDSFLIHYLGPSKGPYKYSSALNAWLMNNFVHYDVVIIHGIWLYNSYGTYRAWRAYKQQHDTFPDLYVMPHGMLDPYFQKAPERRLKSVRNSIVWHSLEKKVINGADAILFTCQRELELARETFRGYYPKREVNVTYGIQDPPPFVKDMEVAFFQRSGLKEGDTFWLFLSRIHSKKGVDLLIKAYISIKESKLFNDIPKLVIAGPIDGKFPESLVGLATGRNDIIFTGMLQGSEKWGALYLSEAFVLPSHQENFGIAVVEALACGTAVLITDKVNIYKEIAEGKAGLIYEDTEEGVSSMLRGWLNSKSDLKKQMSNNALKVFKTKFSVENSVREMISRLNRLNIKR